MPLSRTPPPNPDRAATETHTISVVDVGASCEHRGVHRVAVVDDDLLVREGVAALLATDPRFDVVGRYEHGAALLEAIAEVEPHLVVTDIRMPPTRTDEGIRLAAELRDLAPGVGVVVLSQFLEPSFALALLEGGDARRGYLLKERIGDPDRLFAALAVVAGGGSWVDEAVVDALLAARSSGPGSRPRSPLDALSDREVEVLGEVAKGRSNASIGEVLYISERSVEKHVASILRKLGIPDDGSVNRRVSATLAYLARGAG